MNEPTKTGRNPVVESVARLWMDDGDQHVPTPKLSYPKPLPPNGNARACRKRGWAAAEYIDRCVSGAKDRRPALDRLVADARRRRF
jgi:hypothetical protein